MQVERAAVAPITREEGALYTHFAVKEKLGIDVLKVVYLGGGSFGRAFLADIGGGRRIVVKFILAQDMLAKEVFDLGLLSSIDGVTLPHVIFSRRGGGDVPIDCYAMEYIDEKNALTSLSMFFMSKSRRCAFADEVTSALHVIHCVTNDKFGDTMSPDCSDWLDYYRPFAASVMKKAEDIYARGELAKRIVSVMHDAWAQFDVIFSERVQTACLIHGDLNIANVMVDKNNRLHAFIDPLNCMYADREYDLFQFDNLTGKRFFLRQTYMEKYGASRLCDVKCAFYALWNEVYCYIRSGKLINVIMNPLVKNMRARLSEL